VHQPLAQVLTHDASNVSSSPVHSHWLEASPPSAGSLSPSHPCTPTFDDHSPAVGRCCHSSTWRIGVDTVGRLCRTYMNTPLSKVRLITQGVRPCYLVNLAAFPQYLTVLFQANGSHQPLVSRPLASTNARKVNKSPLHSWAGISHVASGP